jgi:hypothetical protein
VSAVPTRPGFQPAAAQLGRQKRAESGLHIGEKKVRSFKCSHTRFLLIALDSTFISN